MMTSRNDDIPHRKDAPYASQDGSKTTIIGISIVLAITILSFSVCFCRLLVFLHQFKKQKKNTNSKMMIRKPGCKLSK